MTIPAMMIVGLGIVALGQHSSLLDGRQKNTMVCSDLGYSQKIDLECVARLSCAGLIPYLGDQVMIQFFVGLRERPAVFAASKYQPVE
jgi:hypothetical protein|mmetsp:Transcript_87319/g.233803  ORF Transcript_87319/g.233803 Transcript_87319/m.233803 type:complete len:88 (-) Transcript_87319:78-341(-)